MGQWGNGAMTKKLAIASFGLLALALMTGLWSAQGPASAGQSPATAGQAAPAPAPAPPAGQTPAGPAGQGGPGGGRGRGGPSPGQLLFADQCAGCHGTDSAGG